MKETPVYANLSKLCIVIDIRTDLNVSKLLKCWQCHLATNCQMRNLVEYASLSCVFITELTVTTPAVS